MYYSKMFTALVGLTSLVAAGKRPHPANKLEYTSLTSPSPVPASVERDITPAQRGLKHKSRAQRRSPLIIQENINIEPQITVVEENLGALSQLATIAEQEFAALVQSQVALITQLETIKNNIRVNHFKARFSQVVSLPPRRLLLFWRRELITPSRTPSS